MKTRSVSITLCILFIFLFSGCTGNKEKPNILFILVDDLGWADIGVNGSTYYETPNIDRLASEGIKFTNAYSAH